MSAPYLLDPLHKSLFPDVSLALTEPDGLLAVGGDLSTERLVAAYQRGIFPWYNDDQPILWWSPDPRMVLYPDELKVSRSLRKTINKDLFKVTIDKDFHSVISSCSAPRRQHGEIRDETWIHPEMIKAYDALHKAGYAHSVECWHQDQLVGGLYGIAIGSVFFGESMFSSMTDASKVAFVTFVRQLQEWGYKLIDCQVYTEHLASLGARLIPRNDFISQINQFTQIKAKGLKDFNG